MKKIKLNTVFIILVFINITLFALYLEKAKNLVLLDSIFSGGLSSDSFLIAMIIVTFLAMWLVSPKKEHKLVGDNKTVTLFNFDKYSVQVEVMLAEMYDLIKKYEEINYADVFFTQDKVGYNVDLKVNAKEDAPVGELTDKLVKEIESVFKDKYHWKEKIKIEIVFTMGKENKEIVPEDIKNDIRNFKKDDIKKSKIGKKEEKEEESVDKEDTIKKLEENPNESKKNKQKKKEDKEINKKG